MNLIVRFVIPCEERELQDVKQIMCVDEDVQMGLELCVMTILIVVSVLVGLCRLV